MSCSVLICFISAALIYIPKTAGHKKRWGEGTSTRQELRLRNHQIYSDYLSGASTDELSSLYCLSLKSIQRIIGQEKKGK
ncbi:CD3324 family protein [Enterocloster clostridioformis]|uniref:CD3324 family protein n=1 Tax=Enterocloster clostridioformis TaxID=1531 RepID=UPI0009B76C88|nr:CD3324 family protein [Enterocloster clostridioformis]